MSRPFQDANQIGMMPNGESTLHMLGLLQASFRSDAEIRCLRLLARHRAELIRHRAPHILHMQQALKLMNIQLSEVLSEITGLTGQAIVRAIVGGERDAAMCECNWRASSGWTWCKNGCKRHIAGVAPGQVFSHTLEIVIVTQNDGPVATSCNLRTEGLPALLGITTGCEKVQYALGQLGKQMQIWRIDAICVNDC
jgi:hypothetical protein